MSRTTTQMPKQITEITKRDLREVLATVKWAGRLEETEFLSRLISQTWLAGGGQGTAGR